MKGLYARMEIPVLKKHILKGEKAKGSSCAIALAVKDATKCKNVNVGGDEITITTHDGKKLSFVTPSNAEKFINKFDDTDDGSPEREKLKPIKVVAQVKLCDC